MAVSIKEINIQNLGPIQECKWELGTLNVIHGKNETGKTYLVEFLIRSLFKKQNWHLRSQLGRGKIIVEGLGDTAQSFSPSSDTTLEDYYPALGEGISPDLSNLLVIKGAQVELGAGGDVDRTILKKYLSSKKILGTIEETIYYKTIQDASIEGHHIIASSRGPISTREDLQTQHGKINELFEEINEKYSGGYRKQLEQQKIQLQEKITQMEQAKKHKAYLLSNQKETLNHQRQTYDKEKLESLLRDIERYHDNKDQLERTKKRYQQAVKKSKHFEWLQQAAQDYEALINKVTTESTSLVYLPLIILLLAVSAIILLFYPIAALIPICGAIITVILYWRTTRQRDNKPGVQDEINNIGRAFEEKLGEPLTDVSQLKNEMENQKEAYHQTQMLESEVEETQRDVHQLKRQICDSIKTITGEDVELGQWKSAVEEQLAELKNLDDQINALHNQLLQLDVDETDYVEEEQPAEYDQAEYETLKRKLQDIEGRIEDTDYALSSLRDRIRDVTGDDVSASWETLIQHLREKRNDIIQRYKHVTAKIVGQIAVMDVLKEFRKQEDKKIVDNIQSEVVRRPLYEVTQRYTDYKLDDNTLYVSNDIEEFSLNELSTGAQEQVFLALRMGFCSRMLKNQSAFFIFDDAFQYSDWDRRELLIDKAVDLATNGWQIIYFTMDDHIKQLFDRSGASLGDQYKSFELTI